MGFIIIAAGLACIVLSIVKRIESALFKGLGAVVIVIGVIAALLL